MEGRDLRQRSPEHVGSGTGATGTEKHWADSSLVQGVLEKKHSLLVMLVLYQEGSTSTSALIRRIRAHPATVIAVLRNLERLGILTRRRQFKGRREVRAQLSLRGLELIETPFSRWGRLVRNWD